MKILVISYLYPPVYVGGYELGCYDVVQRLKRRGHEVKVLTSTYGVDRPVADGEVYRWLQHDSHFHFDAPIGDRLRLFQKELHNRRAFRRLVATFKPNLIYAWAMRHISLSLLMMAQELGLPVAYFVSDDWLSRWEGMDRWFQMPSQPLKRASKRALRALAEVLGGGTGTRSLDLRNAQFASEFLKCQALSRGKPVADARVIHWGVDTDVFVPQGDFGRPLRKLLYVGQVAEVKGVHTAIEAFRQVAERDPRLTLTIAGGSIFPDYESRVRQQARALGLAERVHFTSLLPREQLPALYRQHDALLFPSIWDEPFSITLVEGMASGLAVVGTTTGGSAEILRDGENALTFPKEDADACAAQLQRLIDRPNFAARLRQSARHTVEERFRIETMVEQIDVALGAACAVAGARASQ
jgi:glycosyltransferase involved in cell wall biosynthesis